MLKYIFLGHVLDVFSIYLKWTKLGVQTLLVVHVARTEPADSSCVVEIWSADDFVSSDHWTLADFQNSFSTD